MGEGAVDYRVDVARLGGWDAVPGPELFWMEGFDRWEPLALLGVLARAPGVTALVNTGPPMDLLPAMNAHWRQLRKDVQLRVAPEERIEAVLARLDVRPADVDLVVCTPFQAYALGNVDLFPRAEICLSRRGWIDFHAPNWRQHPHDVRAMAIPDRILVYLVTTAWSRVRLLRDEEEVAPDLSVFWTGGHHRSSLAVRIRTTRGTVVAGDCFFRYENLERMHPIGICESLEECLRAYDRIRREADVPIPLYDQRVLQRHPGGRVA
jgi:glyoxylase-like metal-dependent hydrolase (beta-lactamase superfamily II)